ncbi:MULTISPECIES: trehalose operon repressor TreR [Orbaceae]|uniref:trehalose operon repressor TreR n=1 Tax=Orbaceae TaxID=1240483 RepID=UPI00081053B7|nr:MULTISPECIES: trehalose operon repressor TreR [Orbaceae]MBX4134221.1 HTH-type transcriptional regulator TreR [Frischella sp. Ac48]MCX8586255.1 HTH-type transcriptional regulator TreR [Gilliamella sp. B3562]MCX8662296.1 HTH-type transcriptional regulator TreR [Gilliamella sp. B2911]MCX8671430.1 HTH-type transcriptional regulator TreR [Gilliamella sp. B2785]MCX8673874.1 HTH-type transcriptional regulator TreR [Gilliamella sp. B3023]
MNKPSPNLTIKDIAKLSGVSKSTVSRVINHDPMVKESTRNKVMAIVEQYQFTPSKSARAMRGYGNKVIGIIVTRLDSISENHAVRNMLPVFYANGYDPIIIESQFSPQKVEEHLTMLKEKQADGVVIFAFTGLNSSRLTFWQDKCVVIARPFSDYTCICYDDVGAVNKALTYLYQKHKKIGYIGITKQDQTTGELRYQAYTNFCHTHKLKPNAVLGKLSYYSGYELAESVLVDSPTAIICATDSIALGLNKFLSEKNINNIVVISIGSSELLKFLFTKTITVDLGFDKAGTYAANELLQILQSGAKPKIITVPSQILI